MRKNHYLFSIVVAGCLVNMISGCSSSSDSSSDKTVKLSPEIIDDLGSNVGNLLPGCVYVSNMTLAASAPNDVNFFSLIDNDIVEMNKSIMNAAQASSWTETHAGDCGGQKIDVITHGDGDTSYIRTYDDYCKMYDAKAVTLNGTATAVDDGHPTDFGPVIDETRYSTSKDGVEMETVVSGGESTTKTVTVSNYKFVYGNPSVDAVATATASNPSTLTIDSVQVAHDSNLTYNGKNIKVSTYTIDADKKSVTVTNGSYDDPELGTVTVRTDAMEHDRTNQTLKGTITITGGGNSATFTADTLGTGVFTAVDDNNQTIGALDCSTLLY